MSSHPFRFGLQVSSLPEDVVLSTRFGTYSLTASRTPAGFRIERRALILPQTVAPRDYPDFRSFCARVDEAERARALLRRKP